MPAFDVVVAGAGGVGSAAAFHLSRRGAKVLALDRFAPPHDRGSSHGHSRIIRLAYYEHPDYVPLLRRAWALWAELAELSGETLYTETGLLQVGPPDGAVVRGVLASAGEHGLDVESLTPEDARRRFPGLRVPEGLAAVYERQAGALAVERCVAAHLALSGAEVRRGELLSWRPEGAGVRVETESGSVSAGALVLAPGPWAPGLIAGLRLEVRRKGQFWFGPPPAELTAAGGCPAFLYELPEGVFYGIPAHGGAGLKAAEHTGGRLVADPLTGERAEDAGERSRVEGFLARMLPALPRTLERHAPCFYTLTPDQHFVLDRHPGSPRVVYAAGLSGHGFKFVPALGEALAELALDGRTRLPVGFLAAGRFAA